MAYRRGEREKPVDAVDTGPLLTDPWFDTVERLVGQAEKQLIPIALGVVVLVLMGILGSFRLATPGDEWALAALRLVHLPASWLAALLLAGAGFWAALGLVQQRQVCFLLMQSMVPTGGMFAFIALWSGALASKGFLGEWVTVGPREVAELVLLAVYLTAMAVPLLVGSREKSDRVMAVIVLLGLSQVPIVFFSVEWLQLLIPPGTADTRFLAHDAVTLWPLGVCAAGFWGYATLACLLRVECLAREEGVWDGASTDAVGDEGRRVERGVTE